jgi:hypothetical protein
MAGLTAEEKKVCELARNGADEYIKNVKLWVGFRKRK